MMLCALFGLLLATKVLPASALGQSATIVETRHLSANNSYDFVIVGGGIAGLTVADRLTENSHGR